MTEQPVSKTNLAFFRSQGSLLEGWMKEALRLQTEHGKIAAKKWVKENVPDQFAGIITRGL